VQQLEKRNNSRYFEIWKKYVKYVFSNTAGADRFSRFAALTGVPMTAMCARPTSVATGRGAGGHRTLIVDRCVLVSITVRPTQCRAAAHSVLIRRRVARCWQNRLQAKRRADWNRFETPNRSYDSR